MINDRIEITILRNLIGNETYARKVLPFLKDTYFKYPNEKRVFQNIKSHLDTYNQLPTQETILISVFKDKNVNEDNYLKTQELVENLKLESTDQLDWLIDNTEEFCKEKALHLAMEKSIEVLDSKDESQKTKIPDILIDALGVSFDESVGHEYFEDAEEAYDFYNEEVEKFPCDLEYFNKITNGGVERQTLNVILAGTNVGKTLIMCHLASSYMSQGLNVLYITLEMRDKKIRQRIDANLLGIPMNHFKGYGKERFISKIASINNHGKLFFKQYPTSGANVIHFKQLLKDLEIKKRVKPDVMFVDYLNICASSRLRDPSNLYQNAKAVAEELRGLAVEYNIPVWSATQTNRSGFKSSDVELGDTAESFGVPQTADFMFAAMTTDVLMELNQYAIKQLKNRYTDKSSNRKFVIGVDYSRMRLYDVDQEEHIPDSKDLHKKPDKPVFDQSDFGKGMAAERKQNFKGFDYD